MSQHFTDEEKEQLTKLREQLPDIIHAAEKQSKEPVVSSIWGVPLLDNDGTDARVDVILVKFLRARPNDLPAAATMLTNTLKWRAEFKIDELLDEKFPDVFQQVGYTYKRDKLGRPVTYNVYGGLDNKQVFGDLERFLRWRVQLMESGMRQLDFITSSYMVQVHDYNGVGLFSFDKDARAASKATIQVLSDNYPETLAVKVFSYVPSWGETVFNIIGRWLSEETKKKFVVVSKASAEKTLAEIIGKENLPEKYGGSVGFSEKAESDPKAGVVPPEAATAHVDPVENAPVPTGVSE
ncbi:Non-classical phosphatidylinositol transfer protein (PITP), partial [Linderina macrospora]